MAELGKLPRATKDGGLYQGHRATPRWNWGRASLKIFPTLCGEGVLAETVQAGGRECVRGAGGGGTCRMGLHGCPCLQDRKGSSVNWSACFEVSRTCVPITAPELTCWVTLGKTLRLPEPLFPLLQMGQQPCPPPGAAGVDERTQGSAWHQGCHTANVDQLLLPLLV